MRNWLKSQSLIAASYVLLMAPVIHAAGVVLDEGTPSGTYTFWITELPPNAEGSGYRAYVSEIGLDGRG